MRKSAQSETRKEKKKRKLKASISTFLIVTMMVAGWYIMMFPTAADLLNKIYNQNSIMSYNNTMMNYSDEDIAAAFAKTRAYNETIFEEQQTREFHYRGPNATGEDYMGVPTRSQEIGSLRIPSIDVNVAIGHGTGDNMLQAEVGHLYGTSIPIDGKNVHAVIAGHSALSTAELFTDLNKVEEGDKFYVTILNKEFEYKVDEINVMLPEDDFKYEQIVPGKNYATLYTCTPYGVNTHRLLVRGELIGSKEVALSNKGFNLTEFLPVLKNSVLLAFVILLPFILMLVYSIYCRYDAKKKSKKPRNKSDAAISESSKTDIYNKESNNTP